MKTPRQNQGEVAPLLIGSRVCTNDLRLGSSLYAYAQTRVKNGDLYRVPPTALWRSDEMWENFSELPPLSSRIWFKVLSL
jgi:hypothetical protein